LAVVNGHLMATVGWGSISGLQGVGGVVEVEQLFDTVGMVCLLARREFVGESA
jgi:hypothetical protein